MKFLISLVVAGISFFFFGWLIGKIMNRGLDKSKRSDKIRSHE